MKFKFNVLNLSTAVVFLLAFVSLMASYATQVMYYVAICFFIVGFSLLAVVLMKLYLKKNSEEDNPNDAIIMHLSGGADGETYVMADESQNKAEKKKKRAQKFDKLLPFLFCVLIDALFIFLFIKSLF